MSADNGVNILCTLKEIDGVSTSEYRVLHTQAIENIWYAPDYPSSDPVLNESYLVSYFGDCKVITSYDEAWVEAGRVYQDVMCNLGFVEYDTRFLNFANVPFPVRTLA